MVERFIECGDYSKGIARIKCTNPKYGHEIRVTVITTVPGDCKHSLEANKIIVYLKKIMHHPSIR
jgi:hypothetical protein